MKAHPIHTHILVGTDGTVYSTNYRGTGTVKALQPIRHSLGYRRVNVAKRQTYIHRLVAETYIDNPDNLREIDHIDGDKANNHVSNLRWMTHKQNINAGMERLGNWLKGTRSTVRIDISNGAETKSFPSMKAAAAYLGCDSPHLCHAIKGNRKVKGWTISRG